MLVTQNESPQKYNNAFKKKKVNLIVYAWILYLIKMHKWITRKLWMPHDLNKFMWKEKTKKLLILKPLNNSIVQIDNIHEINKLISICSMQIHIYIECHK